jgi:hypothetical protein
MKATGYRKATMSELSTGKQRYNRDVINAVAAAMDIRPYELLMHPDEAMATRRVRESAVRITAETPAQDVDDGAETSRSDRPNFYFLTPLTIRSEKPNLSLPALTP